ncbi:Thioredoxin-like 3-2, chloroplastic [Linum grandiflorum]
MSESVQLYRVRPVGVSPSSRTPPPSSVAPSSSFLSPGYRNLSFPSFRALFSCSNHLKLESQQASGSHFPISNVVNNGQGSVQELDDQPVSIELIPISSDTQFDLVIAEAANQQLHEAAIIVWMANWCRKCIYLKPKLERLAADYHPSLRFYCVDVNNVPHKLVARAGVTLWRDGEKQGEVIGGHKAYQVINEVREMIESNIEGDV